jgi:nicotinate-nucleotide pyrophosphorylase (carboxylating)
VSEAPTEVPAAVVADAVRLALAEDVGSGDVTAALVPEEAVASASVVCREDAVLCGRAWFDEVFRQLDPRVTVEWRVVDGEQVAAGTVLLAIRGPARALLTGERTALNFLQLLCATATEARRHADAVAGSRTRILDTRKTIPGLRLAQKYAVRCGGGDNHRVGLFDAVLIKENHIAAAGSIEAAVRAARHSAPGLTVEVEVESLQELDQAIGAGADVVMLDNFDEREIAAAVVRADGRVRLEVSGNVGLDDLPRLAATGVDYVSIGALTKNVRAIDLSMRLDPPR